MTDLMAWREKAPRRDPEGELQRAIVQHLKLLAPANVIWAHIPNGEHRSKRTGARLKALGVQKGMPDLMFVLADGRAAFMELKAKAGRLSPDQKAFAEKCNLLDIEYLVTSDLDQALSVLRAWGALPKE